MKEVTKEYIVYRFNSLGSAGLTLETVVFDYCMNSFKSEDEALNAIINEDIMYEGLLVIPKFTIE